MAKEETIERSLENFEVLEKKFKNLISKCNKSNLVETQNYTEDIGYMKVKNTTKVEHYTLEDGIHIYKMYHGEQPIDYFISMGPIEESYTFENYTGKHAGKKYTAIPFFEYTVGGVRNCLATDHSDHYPATRTISAAVPTENKAYPECDLTCGPGFRTDSYILSRLGDINYKYQEGMSTYLENGDFCGYIRNINPKPDDRELISHLRLTLDKIDALALKTEQSKGTERKGLLKALLSRNKAVSEELEPFQVSRKK